MNERTEYVEKLSAQLVEWDNMIRLLKDRAADAAPATDLDYNGTITALKLKRDEAALQLQKISVVGDDEWDELKIGTEQVWDEVRTIVHDTVVKIK